MKSIKEKLGCPQSIRADTVTENGVVQNMQIFLRSNHIDIFAGERSFLIGRSTSNQRIEWFWGLLRRQVCQFWMNLFATFREKGLFDGSECDKKLIRYCFMDMIKVCPNQYT